MRRPIVVNKLLFALILVSVLTGCTRDNTKPFLEKQGYKEVELTGWRPTVCDSKDDFATGFRAKNSNGVVITGVVCEGFLKGKTIRFD
jgi:hypothetical protein